MRRSLCVALLLLVSIAAHARQRIQGNCEQGGNTVSVSGLTSTTKVQRSFVGCTVTVYATGTVNLSTIYSDNSGTPLANPFQASLTDGSWYFYADSSRYDVKFSSGGIASPFTRGDISAFDLSNINNTRYASWYAGADMGVKTTAAIADAPAGGTVYADFTGEQTCSTVTITKKIHLILMGANYNYSTNCIVFGVGSDGSVVEMQAGGTLVANGGSGNFAGVWANNGAAGTSYALTVDGAEGANTITLSAPDAAHFVAGDYVELATAVPALPQYQYTQLNRVVGVAAGVVTLEDTLTTPFLTASTSTLHKITGFVSNITVKNITCDGALGAGNPYCLNLTFLVGGSISNITSSNHNVGTGGSVTLWGGWYTNIDNIHSYNSGTTATDSVAFFHSSHISVSNVFIPTMTANSDGLGVRLSVNSSFKHVHANGRTTNSRVVKLLTAQYNNFYDLVAENSGSVPLADSRNGINITASSNHNTFTNCGAFGNYGAGIATFSEPQGNKYNTFINCRSIGNIGNAFAQGQNDDHTTIIGGEWVSTTTNPAIQSSSSHMTVIGANIKGNGTSAGIAFGAGADSPVIMGNKFSNWSALNDFTATFTTNGIFSNNETPDGIVNTGAGTTNTFLNNVGDTLGNYLLTPLNVAGAVAATGNISTSGAAVGFGINTSTLESGAVFDMSTTTAKYLKFGSTIGPRMGNGSSGAGWWGIGINKLAADNNYYAKTGSNNLVNHGMLYIEFNGNFAYKYQAYAGVDGTLLSLADGFSYTGSTNTFAVNKLKIGGGDTINKHLSSTASLNFAAWAGADCQDLTVTITGAADGDSVEIGVPTALASTAGVHFTGFVSAANTVTIRGCKITAGASADPAAATVRADVWQH